MSFWYEGCVFDFYIYLINSYWLCEIKLEDVFYNKIVFEDFLGFKYI